MGEAKDASEMGSNVKTDMSDAGGDAAEGDQDQGFGFGQFKAVDQVHRNLKCITMLFLLMKCIDQLQASYFNELLFLLCQFCYASIAE